jgi:hypothetical protein
MYVIDFMLWKNRSTPAASTKLTCIKERLDTEIQFETAATLCVHFALIWLRLRVRP